MRLLALLLLLPNLLFAAVEPISHTWLQSELVECADGKKYTFCAPGNDPQEPQGSGPSLYFSDLTSGPDAGLGDSNGSGAIVTVWGHDLGATQGASTIEFCDSTATCRAAAHVYYWGAADGSGGPANLAGSHGLQEIAFSIPDGADGAGSIRVTVGAENSNTLPFTVRSGNIYYVSDSATGGSGTFADPWDVGTAFSNESPGDIFYFRAGTYDDQKIAGANRSVIYLNQDTAGTADLPIALVAYGTERVIIDAYATYVGGQHDNGIQTPDHYTVSKFDARAAAHAIAVYSGGRIIGNKALGNTYMTSVGTLDLYNSSTVALGNEVYGGTSANQQSHAIYVKGCSDIEGATVAYNYVYDNNFDRGPIIQVNHQQNRCANNQQIKTHRIYANVVDCTDHPSRGIGVYDLSWDDASVPGSDGQDTAGQPEPTILYNNVVRNCGVSIYPATYTNGAHTEWYNNLIIGATYRGFESSGSRVISSKFQNNIVQMVNASHDYVYHANGTGTYSHNAFFGGDATSVVGTNNVTSDPLLNLNITNGTLTLTTGSPAIGAGTQQTEVSADYWNRPSDSPPNIGPTQEVQ